MTAPIIQCQSLSHSYSGKEVLSNINFQVEAGEPIGLVGPNGAGKTTLLSILCGFIRPTAGTVTLYGHKPGTSVCKGKVSALPQDARLDPTFSIGSQLMFYARLQGFNAKQASIESERVLGAVALQDIINDKPDTLSHGMAKRVAIAQALLGNPELILLDEPTAGLDPVNTRTIRSIIAELSPQTTFVISSHDLSELGRLCQHILLLDQGIMSSKQLNDSEQKNKTRFLTIQMESCSSTAFINKLNKIDGIVLIKNPQKNEFIVEYDANIETKMDLKVIHCIHDNNWQYRQLNQGKTLEEMLFFEQNNPLTEQ